MNQRHSPSVSPFKLFDRLVDVPLIPLNVAAALFFVSSVVTDAPRVLAPDIPIPNLKAVRKDVKLLK